jgi:hypothetical protein
MRCAGASDGGLNVQVPLVRSSQERMTMERRASGYPVPCYRLHHMPGNKHSHAWQGALTDRWPVIAVLTVPSSAGGLRSGGRASVLHGPNRVIWELPRLCPCFRDTPQDKMLYWKHPQPVATSSPAGLAHCPRPAAASHCSVPIPWADAPSQRCGRAEHTSDATTGDGRSACVAMRVRRTWDVEQLHVEHHGAGGRDSGPAGDRQYSAAHVPGQVAFRLSSHQQQEKHPSHMGDRHPSTHSCPEHLGSLATRPPHKARAQSTSDARANRCHPVQAGGPVTTATCPAAAHTTASNTVP